MGCTKPLPLGFDARGLFRVADFRGARTIAWRVHSHVNDLFSTVFAGVSTRHARMRALLFRQAELRPHSQLPPQPQPTRLLRHSNLSCQRVGPFLPAFSQLTGGAPLLD